MPPKRKAKQSSVQIPQNPQELETVLAAFLSPNDAAIKKATETLRAFLSKPTSVPVLFFRLAQENGSPNTRQLACVLISKKITKYWKRMQRTHVLGQTANDAAVCRQYILTILHSGTAPTLLIHSISYLTSVIARMDLRLNRWPDLLTWLQGAITSPNANHVEASLRILRSIMNSSAAKHVESNLKQYLDAFLHWISNPPTPVIRYRAIMALEVGLDLLMSDENGEAASEAIISGLINFIPTCNDNHEYDSVATIISILIKSTELEWFDKYIVTLFQGFSHIVVDKFQDTDPKVPTSAVLFICEYISQKPLILTTTNAIDAQGKSVKLIEIALFVCLSLMTQEDSAPFDPEDTPMKMGIRILEGLYEYMPREAIMPAIIARFTEFIQSPNLYQRRAAFVLITTALEQQPLFTVQTTMHFNGAEMSYAEAHLRAACLQLVRETDPSVIQSICLSINWIAQFLPEWTHDENLCGLALQAILQAIATPQVATHESRPQLFGALAGFLEASVNEVPEIAELAVQACVAQASLGPDPEQCGPALDSISCISNKMGGAPFAQLIEKYNVLPLLRTILDATRTPETATLYNQALNLVANVSTAIGAQNWSPQLKELVLTLTQAISTTNFEENDYTGISGALTFLGNLSTGIAPLYDADDNVRNVFVCAYNLSIHALRSLSGVHFSNTDQDAPKLGGFEDDDDDDDEEEEGAQGGGADEEDDEGDDDDEEAYFDMDSLECKATAFQALSSLISALGDKFTTLPLPELLDVYIDPETPSQPKSIAISADPIQRALHFVNDTCSYVNDAFLCHGLQTLADIGLLIIRLCNATPIVGVITPIPPQYDPFMKIIIGRFVESIQTDENPDVVAHALENITSLMEQYGVGVLPFDTPDSIKEFFEALANIIGETAPCLQTSEFKDERSENGQVALESVCAFIGNFARWYGPNFAVQFLTDEIFENLVKFTNTSRPHSFRENAAACLAEIVEFTGPAILPRLPVLFPLALQLFSDSAINVRHNSVFLLGELALATLRGPHQAVINPEDITRAFQELTSYIVSPDQRATAKASILSLSDNANSTAIKLVVAFPQLFGSAPLPQLFSTMPWEGDLLEALKLNAIIPRFYELYPDVMRPITTVIVRQIAVIAASNAWIVRHDLKPDMVNVAKHLVATYPAEAQLAGSQMTQEEGEAFQKLLQ